MKNYSVFTVTNWDRREFTKRFLKEMSKNTDLYRSPLTIVENGDGSGEDFKTWLINETGIRDFQFHEMKERHGLATIWNWCMLIAVYANVVICNDDCVPNGRWEDKLDLVVEKLPHKMFLLCHPNGFSGFCLDRSFWQKHNYFNYDFPEGYYEDDDWFLKVGFQEGCANKQEIFQKYIFSYYDNYGESLFLHVPHFGPLGNRKWDKKANKAVFDHFWIEVAPGTKGAIENKGGKWYIPKTPFRTK